ncbi:conserved hypothetical protein [Ricinus communis]|uniref:Uncharacterized protein n=1 Tax=Ricinus communis TaxID=3988 RepID=B9R837_RICCO|nr:conserved hypothetical protein [Ricinus communis]
MLKSPDPELVSIIVIDIGIGRAVSESSSLALSPTSSPLSVPFQPFDKQGFGDWNEIDSTVREADYGYWDPSPRSGGGYYSPIPHGEVS